MNQKIPVVRLAERLAKATGVSTSSAEAFIKAFFDLASRTLVAGEKVKIKGLGTFAADPSNSEQPVEFAIDRELADTLNAPFAAFEPEVLRDDLSLDEVIESSITTIPDEPKPASETEPTTEPEPEPAPTPEPIKAEVEPEPESAPEQEPAPEPTPEPVKAAPEPEPEPVPEPVPAPTPDPVEVTHEPEPEPEPETAPEPTLEPVKAAPEPEPAPEPKPTQASTSETSATPKIEPHRSEIIEEEEEELYATSTQRSDGPGFGMGFLIGILVGLTFGACAIFFAIDYIYPTRSSAKMESKIDDEIASLTTPSEALAENVDTIADIIEPSSETADTVTAPVEPAVQVAEAAQETPKPEPAPAPETPKAAAPVKDKVQPGYNLAKMAARYYGNKNFWVYIYEENKARIKNPNLIPAGQELVIPPAEKYGIDAKSQASIKKASEKAEKINRQFAKK